MVVFESMPLAAAGVWGFMTVLCEMKPHCAGGLPLRLDGLCLVARRCALAARFGTAPANIHVARALLALGGAGFAVGDARVGLGMVALGEIAGVLLAGGAAIVAELRAKVHPTLRLACRRTFVAERRA